MRHFLRFIDLDDTFVAHGFRKKVSLTTVDDIPEFVG